MNNYFFYLLLLLSGPAFCQDYIPLLDNTSWNVRIASQSGFQYHWIESSENITIDGMEYVKYTDVPQMGEVLIREDVSERKVYKHNGTSDQILFDFSLEVDDMITLADSKEYTVLSKDSVTVMSGRKRVRLYLLTYIGGMAGNSETWIEGVGNSDHPLVANFDLVSDPAYNVFCSYNNGEPQYNHGLATSGTAVDCPEPTADYESFTLKPEIQILPNPMSGEAVLSTDLTFDNASLTVHNTLGQQVFNANNITGQTFILERNNLPAGIYFAQVVQNGHTLPKR